MFLLRSLFIELLQRKVRHNRGSQFGVCMFSRLRVFVFVFIITLLSGCTLKFAYNQLEWLIPWYLEDFIEFEGGQIELFDSQLDDYLSWHRHQALPEYANFLERLSELSSQSWNPQNQVFEPYSRAKLLDLERQLNVLLSQTVSPLVQPSVVLIRQLSADQIEQIRQGFTKSNKKFSGRFEGKSEVEIREERAQKVTDLFESFLGELNEQQQQLIAKWQKDYIPMEDVLLSTRQRWQTKFLEVLTFAPQMTDEVLSNKLTHLYTQGESYRLPEHQLIYDANKQEFFKLVQVIQSNSSHIQYEYLQEELSEYQQDLTELAQRVEPEPMFEF